MKHVKEIMKALLEKFPDLNLTTLNSMRGKPDSFKILISCLLSLRTQDKNTKIASERLFAVADTPKAIIALSDKKLEQLIFSSGHYKKKARILKHVSKEILTTEITDIAACAGGKRRPGRSGFAERLTRA